jgi:hypothetical protein
MKNWVCRQVGAPRLSHYRHDRSRRVTPSSRTRASTQINSAVAFASALYSASVLERDIVGCFLALQEIKLGPMKMANPPVERLSSRSPAQSASEYALRRVEVDF